MHVISDQGTDLPFEQRVMLWSMRVWVMGLHHEIDATIRIQQTMDGIGADQAAPYLEGFMFALKHGARRRIEIHCACHPHLEPDERILLDVLAFAQEGRSLEALLLLRGLCRQSAIRPVLRSAEGLGTELALANHFLQPPIDPSMTAPRFETLEDLMDAVGRPRGPCH